MKRLTTILIAAALLCPLMAEARPRHGQAPMAPRHGMKMKQGERSGMRKMMAAKLELTDEQKAKMEKLRTDFQLSMVDQQAKVRKGQIQLRQLMRDDKAAVTAVEAQIDQMARLRAESAKMRFRHHAEMQSILTDKQKEMLKELREDRPGKMRGMMMHDDDQEDDDDSEPDGEEG